MFVTNFSLGILLVVSAWSLWVRRLTIHSRWDAPLTFAIALIALCAVLVAPWRPLAEASFPLAGKYYLLMAASQIMFFAAEVLIIKGIYQRLMPDDRIGPFIRTFILPVVIVAVVVMLVCFVRSPLTSTMTADHLYLRTPDVWLSVYWGVMLGTATLLALIAIFGLVRLRADQRSSMVDLYAGAVALGLLTVPVLSVAVNTDRPELATVLVWPVSYMCLTAIAFAAGIAWRQWYQIPPLHPRPPDES